MCFINQFRLEMGTTSAPNNSTHIHFIFMVKATEIPGF